MAGRAPPSHLGAEVKHSDEAGAGADGHLHARVIKPKRGEPLAVAARGRGGVQGPRRRTGAGVKALQHAVLPRGGHEAVRGGDAQRVDAGGGAGQRRHVPPLLQTQSPELGCGPRHKQLRRGAAVGQGPARPRHAGAVVLSKLGVELQRPVRAQKHGLGVVLRQHLEVHNLGIKVPLKLQRQLVDVVHPHLRRDGQGTGQE